LRADAPGNHELENGYWRYRDPWRTEQPPYRYVYFNRGRQSYDVLSEHFQMPSGYKPVVRRPAEASMNEAVFYLTSRHFAHISPELQRIFGPGLNRDLAS